MDDATDLLARLKQHQTALGLSERALCRAAGVSEQAIKRLRAGHRPQGETLARLMALLDLAPLPVIAISTVDRAVPPSPVRVNGLPSLGRAQTGAWHPPPVTWAAASELLHLPPPPGLPLGRRFALTLQAPGLDRLFAEGTRLILMSYADLGRDPTPGDRVAALRTDPQRNWECGVWEYACGPDGQAMLWPRSQAPGLALPLILHAPPALAALGPDGLPDIPPGANLLLLGVAVQSITPEPWVIAQAAQTDKDF